MSSQPPSSGSRTLYATIGDTGHAACVVSSLLFAGAVVLYAGGDDSESKTRNLLFDAQWKYDGFCVAKKDKPYWTSHDICLYVDVAMALLLFLCYQLLRTTPGLEGANKYIVANVFGMVAHGIGHGGIAKGMREHSGDSDTAYADMSRNLLVRIQEDPLLDVAVYNLPFILFWVGLIWASMPQSQAAMIVTMSILAQLGQTQVSPRFAFTYVQTVLLLCFSLNQTILDASEKNFAYALHPVLVAFPTIVVGWIESTMCTAFVQRVFYGHVIYDGYIALSINVWYLMCYLHARRTQARTGKEKNA